MDLTLLNGEPVGLAADHRALAFGDGLFETCLCFGHQVESLSAHLDRLYLGSQVLQFNWTRVDEEALTQQLRKILHRASADSFHVLKIMLLRSYSGRGYGFDMQAQEVDCIIQLKPYQRPAWVSTGVNVMVGHPISENPQLAGIKHLNRLDSVLAKAAAESNESHEMWMVDQQDAVVEGSMSNLFYKIKGGWYTPPILNSGVNGIVRQYLLTTYPQIQERRLFTSELENVESAFICNSLIGIVSVVTLNGSGLVQDPFIQQLEYERQLSCLKKLIIVCVLVLVATGLGVINYASKELQKPLLVSQQETTYVVEPGSSLRKVLADFSAQGWIQYPKVHELWLRHRQLTKIQRGEYEIVMGETVENVVANMVAGNKKLRLIQFIEGKTFADNLNVIAQNNFVEKTIHDQTAQQVFATATGSDQHFEGWMFPDTYYFEAGMTDLDIIKLAYKRMQKVLEEEWSNKSDSTQAETPYEALILASIIEKETGAAFERDKISGVFTRRLERGMKLQTDPTVIYGLGEKFDGNLTRADLRADTPYNTYTRKGLPPSPIANPGREAIRAALNPAQGSAVFFVAKGDGTHYFSTTLKEHNQAVRQYQRFGRRSDYQSSPATVSE